MSKLLAALVAVLLVLQLSGCATARTLDAAKPGAPVVYSGTRLDLYAMNGGCCAMDRFGAEAPSYPGLDLPGSALLDTLLLPLSLLTVIGVSFQATGGL
ncbi:MAG: YceK/YidQ family lipoprotein [Pseudomonas prosekii]